jgi:hypothetical protein
MNRRILILAAVPLVLITYCAFRNGQEPHPAVVVVQQWAENAPWTLLSHGESGWGTVHGHAGWIAQARCRDAEGRERSWWFMIQDGRVRIAVPVDAQSDVLRETAAAFADAYGTDP